MQKIECRNSCIQSRIQSRHMHRLLHKTNRTWATNQRQKAERLHAKMSRKWTHPKRKAAPKRDILTETQNQHISQPNKSRPNKGTCPTQQELENGLNEGIDHKELGKVQPRYGHARSQNVSDALFPPKTLVAAPENELQNAIGHYNIQPALRWTRRGRTTLGSKLDLQNAWWRPEREGLSGGGRKTSLTNGLPRVAHLGGHVSQTVQHDRLRQQRVGGDRRTTRFNDRYRVPNQRKDTQNNKW